MVCKLGIEVDDYSYYSLWKNYERMTGGNLAKALRLTGHRTGERVMSSSARLICCGPMLQWPVESLGEPPEAL
jgi:hypothetical protein